MEKEMLLELLKSIKESNARLNDLEILFEEIQSMLNKEKPQPPEQFKEEDIVVPITEEVYNKICKEIGSGGLFFMAIA